MSGGSLNYGYSKLQFVKEELDEMIEVYKSDLDDTEESEMDIELYEEFSEHLTLVIAALRAIEWVHSGDCSYPHDSEAILKVFENISKKIR